MAGTVKNDPNDTSCLCIIPARGGSKGIPRKNLRVLHGLPLIAYAIRTALEADAVSDVVVSTEDEEIAATARRFGAQVVMRPEELSGDDVTIEPVVAHTLHSVEASKGASYEVVVTVQPTAPLLTPTTLGSAIRKFLDDADIDTLLSAKEMRHLTWVERDGVYVPNFERRVNRAQISPIYLETGAFFICSGGQIREFKTRFGERVDIFQLPEREAVDIDSRNDWALAEALLSSRRIAFVVAGNAEIGLGHVYRALSLASELTAHQVEFFVGDGSELAYTTIAERNYPVTYCESADIPGRVSDYSADIIINDTLDTSKSYIAALKTCGASVISFEDLGEGADDADIVINALYPERHVRSNAYHGSQYFVARNEFIVTQSRSIQKHVRTALISFGGTDPSDLTRKVLASIEKACREKDIHIEIVLGAGYPQERHIDTRDGVSVSQNVLSMADKMRDADVVFTSAGRTVYEVACTGTPAIVLAQNARELTHFFASNENGFVNLGLGTEVSSEDIEREFLGLVSDHQTRELMKSRMLKHDLKQGRQRVLNLILSSKADMHARY